MERETERRIIEIAGRQHGVITHAQLRGAGLLPGAIKARAFSGRLRRLHRSVFLVGPVASSLTRTAAALLAYGADATLSHRSAAVLRGVTPSVGGGEDLINISVAGRSRTVRPGVRLWQGRSLAADEREVLHGLPVTSTARTLVDLAGVLVPAELEQAVARAERERLIESDTLAGLPTRYHGRAGIPALRAVLRARGGPALTCSEAEARFLALIRRARLPPPEVNAAIHGYEVDFLWRGTGLGVEVDGYRYHSSRSRFESDRQRAAHLAALGVQLIPLTWRQVVEDELATVVQVGQALVRAGL